MRRAGGVASAVKAKEDMKEMASAAKMAISVMKMA